MPTAFRFQVNQSVKWLYFNALYSVRLQVNRIQIYYFWHHLPYERHDNIDSLLAKLTGSLLLELSDYDEHINNIMRTVG